MVTNVMSNVEGEIIDHVASELIRSLDLEVVLDKLLKNLISSETWERLGRLLRHGETSDAVRQLIVSIKRNPPGYLDKLIEVLQSEQRTRHYGDMIQQGTVLPVIRLLVLIQGACHYYHIKPIRAKIYSLKIVIINIRFS